MPFDRARPMVFLTGLPGVGKTYWARQWAALYGWSAVDLDEYIEQQQGVSVARLMQLRGEAGFRPAERWALHDILLRGRGYIIVACGGGTPAFFDNLARMQARGLVVYLEASPRYVAERLDRGGLASRPLLSGDNAEERLEQLLSTRERSYRGADCIVRAETLTTATFDEIIERCIKQL